MCISVYTHIAVAWSDREWEERGAIMHYYGGGAMPSVSRSGMCGDIFLLSLLFSWLLRMQHAYVA
jgi:hypothetical protein